MRRMLAATDGPHALEAFLPEVTEEGAGRGMLQRAGVAGKFLAALELARKEAAFQIITIAAGGRRAEVMA